jgi:hypothetical protein
VSVRANDCDLAALVSREKTKAVRPLATASPSWLQVEFVDAVFHVEGHRVRSPAAKLSLRASCGAEKWDVIPLQEEQVEGDGVTLVKCQGEKGYPIYRLVLEEPPDERLVLLHFGL